jgi:hypothetical protein
MKLSEFVFRIIEEMEDARYPFTTSEVIEEERYQICLACDHYDEESQNCKECQCFVPNKVKQCYDYCPIGKWDRDQSSWERYYKRFEKSALKKYPECEEWINN